MHPFVQACFLAAALPLAGLASGQTIETGGKTVGMLATIMIHSPKPSSDLQGSF